jgi:hypothetical protein
MGSAREVYALVAAVSLRSTAHGRGELVADVGLVVGPAGDRPRPDRWETFGRGEWPGPWPPKRGDRVWVELARVIRVDRG